MWKTYWDFSNSSEVEDFLRKTTYHEYGDGGITIQTPTKLSTSSAELTEFREKCREAETVEFEEI